MKIEYLMKEPGERHSYESKLREIDLEEILLMIASTDNLICVVMEVGEEKTHRRWVRAEDIKEVFVTSDNPPKLEIADAREAEED